MEELVDEREVRRANAARRAILSKLWLKDFRLTIVK
jgi:hypothetical protein